MTEFITENSRRAYPLAERIPDGVVSDKWNRVLVDACIGYGGIMSAGDAMYLWSVMCSGTEAVLRVRVNQDSVLDVSLPVAGSGYRTVYAAGGNIKAFVCYSVSALAEAVAQTLEDQKKAKTGWIQLETPFSMRCVSSSNNMVRMLSVYAPEECTTPLFTGDEEPVIVIDGGVSGGNVTIAAKDGIDIESVAMLQLSGNVLRVSAVTAAADESDADKTIDIMLRGDDCFTVETLPGVKVVECEGGKKDIEPRTEEDPGGILYGGVIKIGTKCKPCCQCEDYEKAFNSIKNGDDKAKSINEMLDEARAMYIDAVDAFNAAKAAAEENVNSYPNIHVSAAGTASGNLYDKATKSCGMKKRVTVTLTVTNMTMKTASVDADITTLFTVPEFTFSSLTWQTAGSSPKNGEELPSYSPKWRLKPGDTLVIAGTYAKNSNSNDAAIPSGTKAKVTLSLPGMDSEYREVTVL